MDLWHQDTLGNSCKRCIPVPLLWTPETEEQLIGLNVTAVVIESVRNRNN